MENPNPAADALGAFPGGPGGSLHVATAGEALVDLVARADGLLVPCIGGSVYNFTRALARQGVGTAYLNPLSRDRYGRALAAGLVEAGATLARPQPVLQPTSLAVVGVDERGQPDYAFYREGVADRAVSSSDLVAATSARPGLAAVCTGCLALAPEDGGRYLPWLQSCRAAGLLVVVDANLRPSVMADAEAWRASIRAALALADVIKVSDEDLAALQPQAEAGLPQPHDAPALARGAADAGSRAGADPLQQARALFALGPAACVALTRGAEGAWLLARDGRTWHARETADLRVADTVGAGDSFLAGLVAGLLSQGHPAQWLADGVPEVLARTALARAVASASHCVQHQGCVPPTQGELMEALERATVVVSGA